MVYCQITATQSLCGGLARDKDWGPDTPGVDGGNY